MHWLLLAILSYLIFAVTSLIDKHLLSGPVSSPKVYAFYVGILGAFVFLIIPFIDFFIPPAKWIFLSILAGIFTTYGLFWLYQALSSFEASRVIPVVGGLTPLFVLVLIYFFSREKELLRPSELAAFLFLVSGSILITYEGKHISLGVLKNSSFAAFFGALGFVLTKYVYLALPFWSGLSWISLGGVLFALFLFSFSKEVRKEILKRPAPSLERPPLFKKYKTAVLFLGNRGLSALGGILQNFSIYLAPLVYITMVNALSGIQYAFLLILVFVISLKFPKFLKEEISGTILIRKALAIFLIFFGLMLLSLSRSVLGVI